MSGRAAFAAALDLAHVVWVAMSAFLRVPEVDEWSLRTEGPLGTGFSAPRGVKDLLRQRRGSSGEGRRPTTSSSQPVTPPIMPDEDGRPGRGSRKERLPAPESHDLEPEPEPSPETDREREERERQRRRRRKKHAKHHTHEGERAEVASRDPPSGSTGSSRQRTPEYPVAAAADKQSPRARKAAQRAAQKAAENPKDAACRISDEARARRRDRMHKGRTGDCRRSSKQRGSCQTPHATPAEGEDSATERPVAASAAQIRLLVETESTQTDDDLLQELLRRRRAYLNEQSQLDGQESASVIRAHEEADQFFAQAAQRARDEAMKTVDASTCLKAALWHGSQNHGQQRTQQQQQPAAPPSPVPGATDPVSVMAQPQNQIEPGAPAANRAQHTDISSLADAAKEADGAPVPAQKNTRGFRLRR